MKRADVFKNAAKGARWASKGIENAGHTYSNFVYGKKHNCPSLSACGLSNTNQFWSFVFRAELIAAALWSMFTFSVIVLPMLAPALVSAVGFTSISGILAATGQLLITGFMGSFFGFSYGYFMGGLRKMQLNRLNWDENAAQNYGRAGAEIGFTVGSAMTGNLLVASYNEVAKNFGLAIVSKIGVATTANLTNINYFSQSYWDKYKQSEYEILLEQMSPGR